MKAKVTEQGLLIPKQFLQGIQEVDIQQQNGVLLIVPIGKNDPILQMGVKLIADPIDDASINYDRYLYGLRSQDSLTPAIF